MIRATSSEESGSYDSYSYDSESSVDRNLAETSLSSTLTDKDWIMLVHTTLGSSSSAEVRANIPYLAASAPENPANKQVKKVVELVKGNSDQYSELPRAARAAMSSLGLKVQSPQTSPAKRMSRD